MPIYVYQCQACKREHEILQKLSDKPATHCPQCGKATLVKQVTAAGFQLKGSGWYASDFKGGSSPDSATKKEASPEVAPASCGGSCACHPS